MERRHRRWWTVLLSFCALVVVGIATVSLLFRLAVDAVPGYRARLEAMVSQAVGHPARIAQIALTWRQLRPSLDLRGVALLDPAGAPLMRLDRLRLGFSLHRLISGNWTPNIAEVYGLQIDADIDAKGHWSLRGVGGGTPQGAGPAAGSGPLTQAAVFDRFTLRNCHLLLHDPQLGAKPLDFTLGYADLRRSAGRLTLTAQMQPPADMANAASLQATINGDLSRTETWDGSWTLDLAGIRGWPWLAAVLAPGVHLQLDGAQLRVSGRVASGQVAQIDLRVGADSVSATRGDRVLSQARAVNLAMTAQPVDGGWRARIDNFGIGGADSLPAHGEVTVIRSPGLVIDARLDRLRIEDFAPWVAAWKGLPPASARLHDLHGELQNLNLHYDLGAAKPAAAADAGAIANGDTGAEAGFHLDATVANLELKPVDNQPGISGFNADISIDRDRGRVALRPGAMLLTLPEVFDNPLPVAGLEGELTIERDGQAWHLSAPQLDWHILGSEGRADLDLHLPNATGESPTIQLHADFSVAEAVPFKRYMPRHWGPHTKEWLTRAIQRGRIPHGHLQLLGPLADFPYTDHPDGDWLLEFDVADGEVAFAPGWPAAAQVQAHLRFHDNSLHVDGSNARLGDNTVDRLSGDIARFHDATVVIDGHSAGEAASYYALLRGSPLNHRLSGLLQRTDASGPAEVNLHLEIPLKGEQLQVAASGDVHFHDAALSVHELDRPIEGLQGDVEFSGRGVRTETLSGHVRGSTINAAIRGEPESSDGVLYLQFDAPVEPADGLFAEFTPHWLRDQLAGTPHCVVRLPLSGPKGGQFTLSSDLRGVTSRLPAPLAKTAADAMPVTVSVSGGTAQPGPAAEPATPDRAATPSPLRVLVDAGDTARVALRFAPGGAGSGIGVRGVEVHLGPGVPHADNDGLAINGTPPQLDLNAALGLIRAIGSEGQAPGQGPSSAPGQGDTLKFLGADLAPQRLFYGRFSLLPTHVVVSQTAREAYSARFEGAGAQGKVDWRGGDGGRVVGRMQAMALNEMERVEHPQGQPQVHETPSDPAQAPTFDFTVDALKIGDLNLGRMTLLTSAIEGGQSLDRFKLENGELSVDAHGRWQRLHGQSSAALTFDASSGDVAGALRSLGYAPNLKAEQTHFSGDLAWQPSADGLEPAQARGTVTLAVHNGTLQAVEPGAGRVLGLLNIYAIPRRLSFDFRDVVSKGLGFDKLGGTFALADGQAQTDDMAITSTSMKMEVRGRIGLEARDFDQRVTVYPDVSTGVTVAATVLTGPIGGGVALLAQQIFNKPFSQIGRFSYRVTGSWDNPQVKAGEGATPAAPTPPADSGAQPGAGGSP